MKILILLLLTLTLSVHAAGVSKQPVMPEKWHTLWKLIDEEVKTIKGIRRLSPRLTHRLVELYSEKIKLVREKENKAFFAASPQVRKDLGKPAFFKESAAMHKEIRIMAMKLLRNFPKYPSKAEVWYTLGLNERDYNKDKDSERFLLNALRFAGGRGGLRHNAMTSLAEYYYNGKKYKKCLKYYDQVVGNANDEWRTKHLYNMSWCHVKTSNYSKAIDNLKLTYQLILDSNSENNPHPVKYTDIGTQVLEAIGVFHILDKRPLEARDFFVEKIKDDKEKAETLLNFARKVADKGFFPEAQEVTLNALEIGRAAKHTRMIASTHLFQLDFYRNFKREDLLFKTAQDLLSFHKETPLEEMERDQAVDRIQAFAGWLQERLAKTKYELADHHPKSERILAYFDILAGINPVKTPWYRYYQGETLYVVEEDSRASKTYSLSFNLLEKLDSKEKDIDELRRKNLNALLSILTRGNVKGKELASLTEYTYTRHLKTWPVDETSRTIYGRLFTLYLDQSRPVEADAVLSSYVKHYDKDIKIQQDMMATLMDDQIKKKDATSLSSSIKRLEKGYLDFDKDKINKAIGILGQLLFEETDKLRRSGDPALALEGLAGLAAAETYPVTIRRQAAFTQSVVLLELGRGKESFEWLGKSIVLMDAEAKESVQEKKDPFGKALPQMNAMSEELLLAQDFATSRSMSEALLTKMCSDKRSEKKLMRDLFSRAYTIRLLDNNKTNELLKVGAKCDLGTKFLMEKTVEAYHHALGLGDLDRSMDEWKTNGKVLAAIDGEKDLLLDLAKRRLWLDLDNSDAKKAIKMVGSKDWLDKTLSAIKKIEQIKKAANDFKLPEMTPFNQDVYNPALEKILTSVQTLAAQAEEYMNGEAELVLRAVASMNHVYTTAANLIEGYTPQGVPDEFAGQFKGFMTQVSKPMRVKAAAQSRQIERLVESGKLESPNSIAAFKHGPVLSKMNWSHPAAVLALPMTIPEVRYRKTASTKGER
ncbi:MAG: hypothetical protein COW79_15830 [Bdellovibrionales bacterium CG22_combo_CG10-13_8_21_14_all_38_13]|nr:MAG: hypothetical protein COW79_15830 [Bdellovibrionales bacterium CG22_combo_CG10-13_8_21_14_all_38_13]